MIDESVVIGDEFEAYVVSLFNQHYFSIVSWSTDVARKHNCRVEADSNPDLVIRHKSTNEKFAVECKFRSHLYHNNGRKAIHWSYPDQISRYNRYQETSGIPVFIVIGLGGSPSYPLKMYCLPLDVANEPYLYPKTVKPYVRDSGKRFYWRDQFLI